MAPAAKPSLLNLPPELRYLIYDVLFPTHETHALAAGPLISRPVHFAVLLTCRKIHLECRPLALGRTVLRLPLRPPSPEFNMMPFWGRNAISPIDNVVPPPFSLPPPPPPPPHLPGLFALTTRILIPAPAAEDVLWPLEADAPPRESEVRPPLWRRHWSEALPGVTHVYLCGRKARLKDVVGVAVAFPKARVVAGLIAPPDSSLMGTPWTLAVDGMVLEQHLYFMNGMRRLVDEFRDSGTPLDVVGREERGGFYVELKAKAAEGEGEREWRRVEVVLDERLKAHEKKTWDEYSSAKSTVPTVS